MRILGLLTGTALALSACAATEPDTLQISEISVSTDLSAIQSREAVSYWQGLGADLETALAREFSGQIAPTGQRILIDIDELSLSSAFEPGATVQETRLSGQVILEERPGAAEAVYTVTASSSDIVPYLPADSNIVTISPTSDAYYRAVVQAFAEGVAETLNARG